MDKELKAGKIEDLYMELILIKKIILILPIKCKLLLVH
jgi:hypothetical protein